MSILNIIFQYTFQQNILNITVSSSCPSHPFPPSGVAAGEGADPTPPPLMFRPLLRLAQIR